MRRKRRQLSSLSRHQYARQLAGHISEHPLFRSAKNIACYIAVDGEIDLGPTIQIALKMGKKVYLPVLMPYRYNRLWFAAYSSGMAMSPNRFGIPEPEMVARQRTSNLTLDLVLTPMVAFDGKFNRLGMGGGYYDRTFAFLRHRKHWKRPFLLGVAYSFQETTSIVPNNWDVPLGGIATNKSITINHG